MTERLKAAAEIKRIFFITACVIAVFFAAGVRCLAGDGWNVKSVEFIPVSDTVPMSRIMERDNDGIYALNLANRGSNSRFSQCFFASGDKCIVTYDDGGTKEFTFSKVRGVSYAEFTAGDGEVICLEALMSDVAKELKQSSEVSVDELAAIIGQNGVGIEYGVYREEGDEIVGNYVRTRVVLNVTDDSSHDHTTALRGRSKTPAQCEATGMTQDCWYCQICGRYFADENARTELDKSGLIIPMTGHVWGEWETVEPATEEKAGKAKRSCIRCPARDNRIIPPDGHLHQRGTEMHWKEPTCLERGLEPHYICTECEAMLVWNDEEKDYAAVDESAIRIPASGHRQGPPEKGPVTPATCSSAGGYNLTYRCEKCGRVLDVKREVFPVDPDAHQWGEWTVTKAAGENEDGEEARICRLCEKTETRVIPAEGKDPDEKQKDDAEKERGTDDKSGDPGKKAGGGTGTNADGGTGTNADGGSGTVANAVSGSKAAVRTGDSSQMAVWIGVLAAAAAGLVLALLIRKRNNR